MGIDQHFQLKEHIIEEKIQVETKLQRICRKKIIWSIRSSVQSLRNHRTGNDICPALLPPLALANEHANLAKILVWTYLKKTSDAYCLFWCPLTSCTAVREFNDKHKLHYFYVFFSSNPVQIMVRVLTADRVLTDWLIKKLWKSPKSAGIWPTYVRLKTTAKNFE